VILSDTDHLWGIGGNRQWAWKSFLRGLNPLYMDPYDDVAGWKPTTPANAEDVRRNLGYTLAFANRMDLASMTPQPALASTAYCLAKPGSEYLVYQPASGAFTVDLRAGTYTYEWFRPETGSGAGRGSLTVEGRRELTPPFNGDAVLYLKVKEVVR
jgi:hypothetical protein